LQWSNNVLILLVLPLQTPQRNAIQLPTSPERNIRSQMPIATPHQSKGRLVRFPGSAIAAEELGVSRSHLHRVLVGERKSPPLVARWNSWLKRHPEFASIQPKQTA
jgi:hypothetical protein